MSPVSHTPREGQEKGGITALSYHTISCCDQPLSGIGHPVSLIGRVTSVTVETIGVTITIIINVVVVGQLLVTSIIRLSVTLFSLVYPRLVHAYLSNYGSQV